MRLRIALIGMSLLLSIAVLRAQKSADDLYQQGRALEIKGDNKGAVQIYERIVKGFPSDHAIAAKATIQLARLSDVQGQEVARQYYDSIIKNYPDQTQSVAEARKWIVSHPTTIEITTPFTKDPWSFSISPDGKSLVFLVTNGATSSLCLLRPIDPEKQCTPIQGTESTSYNAGVTGANPFWSPDGRFIAYFEDHKLKTISVDGGTPKTLARAPNNGGGTWNSAGDIVFTPDISHTLFRVSAKGEEAEIQLTKPDSEIYAHRYPSFLPDGRHFLMYPRTNRSETGAVMIGSLDGDEMKPLPLGVSAAAFAQPNHVVFATGSALYFQELNPRTMALSGSKVILAKRVAVFVGFTGRAAFSVSDAGPIAYRESIAARRRLLWRDAMGIETSIENQAQTISLTGTPRFSPNGHDVSFARNDFSLVINVLNTDTMQSLTLLVGGGLFSSESPIWSPDGMSLAFAAVDGGTRETSQLDQMGISNGGSGRTRIWNSEESKVPTDWHGEFLLFNRNSTTTRGDVMMLSVTGGSEPTPIAATDAQEGNARFSPDGKWIVYESDALGGRPEIFVQPFPGTISDRRRVSIMGGTKAQWSWDEQSIYFLSPDNHLMAAGFTVSADGLPVIEKPVALFPVHVDSTYAPAPDGRFLMFEPTEEIPPIIVLTNPLGTKK